MNRTLQTGDTLPEFILTDQNGDPFDIQTVAGKYILVIYFYPKDDTPGCTKEACSFRDQFEDLSASGALVIGISSDSSASHKNFEQKYHLPFILLSDPDKKVRNLFGVPSSLMGLLPGRVTYIVDRRGIIRHIFNSQLNATQHVEEAQKIIERLQDEEISQISTQASDDDNQK